MKKLLLFLLASITLMSFGKTRQKESNEHVIFKTSTMRSFNVTISQDEIEKTLSKTFIVECDANGDTISETTYASDGAIDYKVNYTYDKRNEMLSFKDYMYGSIRFYTYDQYGNILTEAEYGYEDSEKTELREIREWGYEYK